MLLPPIATEQDTSMTAAVCHQRSFMSTTTSPGKKSSAAAGRHRSTSQRRRQTTSSDGSKYGDSSDSRFSWADDEASGGEESITQTTSSPGDSRNTNYGPTMAAAPPSQVSSSTPSGPFLPPITVSSSDRKYNIPMSTSPLPLHHRGPRDFSNPIGSGTESDPMDRYLLKPLDVTHGAGRRKVSHAKSDSNLPSVGLSRESYDRSWSHGHVTNDVDVEYERGSSPLRRRPIAEEAAVIGGSGGASNVVHLPSIHDPRLARNGLHRRSSVVDTLRSTAATFRLATGYKSNFT